MTSPPDPSPDWKEEEPLEIPPADVCSGELEVPPADVCSGELEVPPAPIVAGGMTRTVGCGRGKKMGGGRVSTVARKLTAAAHLFPLFSRVRHVIPQNATALSGISNDVTTFINKTIETSL